MQSGRTSHHRYVDPLAQIWLDAAGRIGLRVVRGAEAYATTDGNGTLTLAVAEALDPDDSLAQMIFHELCHSLVQGLASFDRPDWGLENVDDGDAWREHACLRVQAVLAGRHGLRRFFAPTTDYRGFYNALPVDPLEPRRDPSVVAAVLGLQRAEDPPWAPALAEALAATAAVAGAVAAMRPASPAATNAADGAGLPTLWAEVQARPAQHPTGLPLRANAAANERCASCAWHYQAGPGRPVDRCQQSGDRIDPSWPACERWEPPHDCQDCGACCREAYQSVTITRRELVRRRHPEMVVDRGSYLELARRGERCAALDGGDARVEPDGRLATTAYACRIYADRPRTCRDFTAGSDHCLTARRRVGLSI